MTAGDLVSLLNSLADGMSLDAAADAAGFDRSEAEAALRSLAKTRQRRARPKADAIELPLPPATSPYPSGQVAVAYADGASRGNPGPAAYGCVYAVADLPVCAEGATIGVATNNVAEYRGAIAAMQRLRGWGIDRCVIRLDSQLVVKQMDGSYRVKDAKLKQLHAEATGVAADFVSVKFEHVPRNQNELADRAANEALDA